MGGDEETTVDENSIVRKMKPHVPGIVTFADHNKPLPWTVTYHAVVMFLDVSGFTSLCEKFSTMKEHGIDKLTTTLNTYLSLLVDGVLNSDGDILKFAGDAILAIWRVGMINRLPAELLKVLNCCLDIQKKCDGWETVVGVKLSVKIGVSAGEMSITFLGNDEYRHYVEMGPAVNDVNAAEAFCKSGYVVMSPGAWDICPEGQFETELMEDGKHRRVHCTQADAEHRRASIDSTDHGSFPETALNHLFNMSSKTVGRVQEVISSSIIHNEENEPKGPSSPPLGSKHDGLKVATSGHLLAVPSNQALGALVPNQTTLGVVSQKSFELIPTHSHEVQMKGSPPPVSIDEIPIVKLPSIRQPQSSLLGGERARTPTMLTIKNSNTEVEQALEGIPPRSPPPVKDLKDGTREECSNMSVTSESPKSAKALIGSKLKLGKKLGKLRKLVVTVTEMRLDLALRLYILLPVLKKMDDNQPLEYLSEMRQVSIVFMNLVLASDVNTTDLLQNIFEVVYFDSKFMHGCLNKVFLFDKGCTFLLIFGLPGYKHENDCAHALICSQKMKRTLEHIDGVMRVSIGVTTGTTFCGVVGHPNRHEYSVIGRRVNMAARLMVHYPGKISCDDNTFSTCRLAQSLFETVITKAMKGLHNVGVIRQYIGQSEAERIAKKIMHSDYPLLGRTPEVDLCKEQLEIMKPPGGENSRVHIIFSGASGLGKTRLSDTFITIAKKEKFEVIQCGVDLEDRCVHNLITTHVLRRILQNNNMAMSVLEEPHLFEHIPDALRPYLYLLNDAFKTEIQKPSHLFKLKFHEPDKRKQLLQIILQHCVGSQTVVMIDDAHNLDSYSWEFLGELCKVKSVLIVLTMRPNALEKPPCHEASYFFSFREVRHHELNGLEPWLMAPLACQMLNVICIPKSLDRILRDRSHGVPSWCQEILRTMVQKKQLVVVLDNGKPGIRQSAIVPNKTLVKPTADSALVDKTCLKTFSNLSVPPAHLDQDEDDEDESLLSSLGLAQKAVVSASQEFVVSPVVGGMKPRSGNMKTMDAMRYAKIKEDVPERIAVFAKGVIPRDIPVAETITELIVARLDSMRTSEQLLIKCAAVLGMTVRRDVLETLIPKTHRAKLGRTIRKLMENDIFVCGHALKTCTSSKPMHVKEESTLKYRCYCNPEDCVTRTRDVDVCFMPRFKNNLLQKTAYNVLMENQKNELHTKAAHSFEMHAEQCRQKIPYFILCGCPTNALKELMKDETVQTAFNPVASGWRKSSQVIDVTQSVLNGQALNSNIDRLDVKKAMPFVRQIVTGVTQEEYVDGYIEILLPIHESLIHHWKMANRHWKVVQTCLEAAALAIYVHNNDKAISITRDALDALLFKVRSEAPPMEHFLMRARLFRFQGRAEFENGNHKKAYQLLRIAADLVGLKHIITPVTTGNGIIKLNDIFSYSAILFRTPKWRVCDEFTLEKGYLLEDLYRMDRHMQHFTLKCSRAIDQFNLSQTSLYLHQTLNAYASLIECCREKQMYGTRVTLEMELLKGCAARNKEMHAEDRCIVASVFAESSKFYFLQGDLDRAADEGKLVNEICLNGDDSHTCKTFTPYYFFICVFKEDYSACEGLMRKMSLGIRQSREETVVYYLLCLELSLTGARPPSNIPSCLETITFYMRAADATVSGMPVRYYSAMTVALWYARKSQWVETQRWFDYWDIYETRDTTFYGLLARCNKLECMLICLAKAKELNNVKMAARLRAYIKSEWPILKQLVQKLPVLQPRAHHLYAYFLIIVGRRLLAKYWLHQAEKMAGSQDNQYELRWLNINREHWFAKERPDDINVEWRRPVTYPTDFNFNFNEPKIKFILPFLQK